MPMFAVAGDWVVLAGRRCFLNTSTHLSWLGGLEALGL